MIETGIRFLKVDLTELKFQLNKDFILRKDGIEVKASFKIKNSLNKSKKSLVTSLSIELFKDFKNAPFSLKATVEGTFTGKSYQELKKFSKVHAPAHLFPFIREIIGNTTMKANIPPLLLPPVNLLALLPKK